MLAAFAALALIAPLAAPAYAAPEFTTQTAPALDYAGALKAYENGDYAQALIAGKMAALGGDAEAQVLVGYILMRGETGPADKDEAAKWFLKAAALDNTDAMVALGELAIGGNGGLSQSDAIKWLKRAADKSRTDAMRALADIYLKGKGTAPDKTTGRNWLIKASNYGDALAQRKLGDIYFDTVPTEALIWYEKAAENGDTDAAYIAAIMYAENFEIKPDSAKAAALLKQAAMGGHAAAMADYGLLVYQGNSAEKSATKAAEWFRKSAIAGDSEGRFLYAFTLAKGDGVPQNYENAYYWLVRAQADSGATGADDYDRSRSELQQRLEQNVGANILERARKRATSDKLLSVSGG